MVWRGVPTHRPLRDVSSSAGVHDDVALLHSEATHTNGEPNTTHTACIHTAFTPRVDCAMLATLSTPPFALAQFARGNDFLGAGPKVSARQVANAIGRYQSPVSYTHLTLPTNREV